MDGNEKNISSGQNPGAAAGISLSDGRAVYKDELSDAVVSDAYLNVLHNTDTDEEEIKKVHASRIARSDRKIITVLAVLNVIIFAVIGIYLLATDSADEYKPIKDEMSFDPETDYFNVKSVFGTELLTYMQGREFPEGIQAKFKPLYSRNTDAVGWIRIENTSIDFPVVKAANNEYYERKNYNGEYDRRGSIFMDYRNKIGQGASALSKNTILYGHHLTQDECIFADVEKYLNVDYYKAHPVIEMNTLYNDYKWKICGCFVTTVDAKYDNGYVFYYWYPDISDSNTDAFMQNVYQRSWFINPAVDVLPTDKLLTLSTCTYLMNTGNEFVEARCVLIARLVRNGESADVDVTGAYENTAKRLPQKWYDVFGGTNPYAGGPFWQAY